MTKNVADQSVADHFWLSPSRDDIRHAFEPQRQHHQVSRATADADTRHSRDQITTPRQLENVPTEHGISFILSVSHRDVPRLRVDSPHVFPAGTQTAALLSSAAAHFTYRERHAANALDLAAWPACYIQAHVRGTDEWAAAARGVAEGAHRGAARP